MADEDFGRPYRPSNGTKGCFFIATYCDHCIHENGDDRHCDILTRSMCFDLNDPEYPREDWVYNAQGNPICRKHVPWDWNKDDDGNWNPQPPEPPIDDPNQLCLPFIFDELEIPKIKNIKELCNQ
jgi:hypothetical protein